VKRLLREALLRHLPEMKAAATSRTREPPEHGSDFEYESNNKAAAVGGRARRKD
jgi:hypothetical protein